MKIMPYLFDQCYMYNLNYVNHQHLFPKVTNINILITINKTVL